MNVRPLRDRILVQRIEETEQRIGGIIVPERQRSVQMSVTRPK